MKRTLAIVIASVLVLASGLALADTVKDRVWIKGPDTTEKFNDWRSIESTLECSYGEWRMSVLANGSRIITRSKSCVGSETMNLGVFPQ